MKVGISLPQIGEQASPENLIRVARHAEELGYDSVWVLERVLWPTSPKDPYLPSPDGSLPEAYKTVLDPIETLAFVAAHTTRVQLGTSVIVLPYHTPVHLARRIATLDVLSGGRALLGVGVGWSQDEFEASNVSFEKRGARSDEMLEAMIRVWTENPVEYDGKFYRIPESWIGPKPVQRPHPPIYVAGFGQYAFDRAARYGNGWNPAEVEGLPLEEMIRQFQATARNAGRADMEVVLRSYTVILPESSGERRSMVGTLSEVRQDIQSLREMGVTHLIHSPPAIGFDLNVGLDDVLRLMEQLMEISK